MSKKKEEVKKEVTKKAPKKPTPLSPRRHLDEFVYADCPEMGPVEKAGFTAFVGEKVWRRDTEWQSVLKAYNRRNI